MKKAFITLAIFLAAASLVAQERTGTISGKVVDGEGKALPGVSVSLTGRATPPLHAETGGLGTFRFLAVLPAHDYVLRAEHEGFKTAVRENVAVAPGRFVEIVLPMEEGPPEETVALTGPIPVVDKREARIGIDLSRTMLQSLPTARDPWEIVRMAPGVVLVGDNVGGIYAGEMPVAVARAGEEGDNTWSFDGLAVTDPEMIGKPSTHWDFDAFEAMSVSSGVGDVTRQTGGIQINIVSRRGGNNATFGGRFHYIDSKFQADATSSPLAAEGLPGVDRFDEFKDFGFNIGLPIFKDKAWFWGSYGVQDLDAFTVYGNPDNAQLTTLAAKATVHALPNNRLELFAQGNRKIKKGTDQWYGNPEGILERPKFHFGTPVFSIQDEQTFGGNFHLSVRWGATNAAYETTPMMDPERQAIAVFDEAAGRYYDSYYFSEVDKWNYQTSIQAVLFTEGWLGASHELRFGLDLSDRDNLMSTSGTPGNLLITRNFVTPQADFNEDGEPDVPGDPNFKFLYFERGPSSHQGVKAWAAHFDDTLSFGRFTLNLGLRTDYQHPRTKTLTVYAVRGLAPQWISDYFTSDALNKLDALLPSVNVPGVSATSTDGAKYAWKDFQPRLSLTYDLFGDGKTVAKLAYSRYSSRMGADEASRWSKNAAGWMGFYWWDTDEDDIVNSPELFWYTPADYALYPVFDGNTFVGEWEDTGGLFWGDFDYSDPTALADLTYSTQPDAQGRHADEVFVALEREIGPDFGVQVSATFRRYTDFSWDLKYFPETGVVQNQGWYEEASAVPADIPEFGGTGEAAGKLWYTLTAEATEYSPWYNRTLRPDYHEDYWGVDVVFHKRMRDRWMLNGSFTVQNSSREYGENGLWNPTNRWATEGRPTSPYFVNFMAKLNGLYEFPLGITAGFTYEGRQGWIQAETFRIVDYTLPNPLSNSAVLLMSPFGSNRLPFLHKLNFRLEKVFRLGDNGRIHAMVDVFNVLNADTPLDRTEKFHGTYYVYEDPELNTWVPNPASDLVNRILMPRVFRLGVRFQF